MPELRGRGVTLLDQMFGHRDEVVEHVLLLLQMPGLVPRFAVFRPAAHVHGHPDAADLEPRRNIGAIRRQRADREPAVAIHHRRMAAVERQPLREVRKNGTRVPSFDVANSWRVSYWLASIGGSGRLEWNPAPSTPDRTRTRSWGQRRAERVEDLRRVLAAAYRDDSSGCRAAGRLPLLCRRAQRATAGSARPPGIARRCGRR